MSPKKEKIMIVEENKITSLNLNLSLQNLGYTVVNICETIPQAKNKLNTHIPDLIIISMSLSKANDGIKLAQQVKEKYKIPFIYLISNSDEKIIEQAKETEPYAYIIKPFNPSSLEASIEIAFFKYEMQNTKQNKIYTTKIDTIDLKNLLLRKCSTEKQIIPFENYYYLDIKICEIFYKDKKIKLTKKENSFFCLLIAKLGIVVSFKQAVEYVWNENGATENSVRTLVWRLRNKLPTNVIKNSSGIGYYIKE